MPHEHGSPAATMARTDQPGPTAAPPDARPTLERIRNDILLGHYRAGEWLRLVEIEARYQATRFETRAALANLAAIGLLEHLPNRGYRITVVDEAEARQRMEIRLLLEVPAAELVLRHAAPADHAVLRTLAEHFAWCVENAATAEIEHANHGFHRGFFALCGNDRLERLINEAREGAWPGGWVHWKTVAANRASAADHFALVDALQANDPGALRRAAFRHLLWRSPPRESFAEILGIRDAGCPT